MESKVLLDNLQFQGQILTQMTEHLCIQLSQHSKSKGKKKKKIRSASLFKAIYSMLQQNTKARSLSHESGSHCFGLFTGKTELVWSWFFYSDSHKDPQGELYCDSLNASSSAPNPTIITVTED